MMHALHLCSICQNYVIKHLSEGNVFFFEALDIDRWDLECEFNNTDHRTDLNGVERLIVRRGQPFTISLFLCSGNYQPGVSALDCIAETGAAPSVAL